MFFVIMQVVSLLALFGTALAKPLALIPRDSIAPPITNPKAGSVWKAGETQTVTWYVNHSACRSTTPQAFLTRFIGIYPDWKEYNLQTRTG